VGEGARAAGPEVLRLKDIALLLCRVDVSQIQDLLQQGRMGTKVK
jgi:hypothetical protein